MKKYCLLICNWNFEYVGRRTHKRCQQLGAMIFTLLQKLCILDGKLASLDSARVSSWTFVAPHFALPRHKPAWPRRPGLPRSPRRLERKPHHLPLRSCEWVCSVIAVQDKPHWQSLWPAFQRQRVVPKM